jgi:hypothetical protein
MFKLPVCSDKIKKQNPVNTSTAQICIISRTVDSRENFDFKEIQATRINIKPSSPESV